MMVIRLWVSMMLLLLTVCANAQLRRADYSAIDYAVQGLEAPTTDSLAKKIAQTYATDDEKVRAIFRWITYHISYNTFILNTPGRRTANSKYGGEEDTASDWKSADEMVADKVFRRRTGVCDGYARLFKVLCDYSGIKAEVIKGYARTNMDMGLKFRTNHSWNAVQIDSAWYLLDPTWASGFCTYSNEFVQRLDEYYFLTPPAQFIKDHYPEDLQWTLLANPPTLKEFYAAPFRRSAFIKYQIASYSPSNGVIEASLGDTVHIELRSKDLERDKKVASTAFFDSSTFTLSPASAFLSPSIEAGKVVYSYVVSSPSVEWLHILYNDDIIMQYKLALRKDSVRR